MRKILLHVSILTICFFCIASAPSTKPAIKTIDGVKHIYNSAVPLHGNVTLVLKNDLTIEPGKQGNNEKSLEEIFFNDYELDADGNIFLLDGNSVKIHKFEKNGKYIKSFLKKGEGPGEFAQYPIAQIAGKHLIIVGRRDKKIGRFGLDGNFQKEWRFKNFYYDLKMIDVDRYIANRDIYSEEKETDFTRCLCLYNIEEQKLLEFHQEKNAGRFFVKNGKSSIAVIPGPQVMPDIIHTFDPVSKRLYFAFNKDYKVFVKNLDGTTAAVICRENENAPLSRENKLDVISVFGRINETMQKTIIAGLPSKLCAIESIEILANGNILIRHIAGYNKKVFDIFSKEGRYLYAVKLPDNFNLEMIRFYNGTICGIENKDDTVAFHRFKIDSLPGIFGQ